MTHERFDDEDLPTPDLLTAPAPRNMPTPTAAISTPHGQRADGRAAHVPRRRRAGRPHDRAGRDAVRDRAGTGREGAADRESRKRSRARDARAEHSHRRADSGTRRGWRRSSESDRRRWSRSASCSSRAISSARAPHFRSHSARISRAGRSSPISRRCRTC